MLDKFFDEMITKGLVKNTKYVLMFDCAGNKLYKAINAKVRDLILDMLKKQGMEIEKNKESKAYFIFYKGYFAGCLSY
jgi:hypothetical protein